MKVINAAKQQLDNVSIRWSFMYKFTHVFGFGEEFKFSLGPVTNL